MRLRFERANRVDPQISPERHDHTDVRVLAEENVVRFVALFEDWYGELTGAFAGRAVMACLAAIGRTHQASRELDRELLLPDALRPAKKQGVRDAARRQQAANHRSGRFISDKICHPKNSVTISTTRACVSSIEPFASSTLKRPGSRLATLKYSSRTLA